MNVRPLVSDEEIERARARVDLISDDVALKKNGRELVGLCPFHKEKTPSFYVIPDKGFFHCFGCGAHGTAITYVMRRRNLAFPEAVREINGGAAFGLGRLSDEEREAQAARAQQAAAKRAEEEQRRNASRANDARMIWLAGKPLTPGDVVWRYLLGRGIDLAALPRVPGALRCHPGLAHYQPGDDGRMYHDATWPAMVAAITGPVAGPDGVMRWTHLATQRTWLAPQSNGEVKKAYPGGDGKKTLGTFRHAGGAVHLARGASGKRWGEAPAGDTVALAEGIEDALSFAVLRPDLRVGAVAMSLGTLPGLALPPGCGAVVVVAQNDPLGSAALRAQARGIAGLRAKGLAVSVFRPPVWVKDINEYVSWAGAAPPAEAVA